MSVISRKKIAVCIAAAIYAGLAAPALAADMVVTAFGGIWAQALKECYVEPFEKMTGTTVSIQLGSPVQWVNQIAANPEHPPIDVLMTSTDVAADAIKKGILEPFDETHLPNLKEIGKNFRDAGMGYGSILNYGAMGLAYNVKRIPNPPTTWQQFVDGTIAGKWEAAIPGVSYTATPPTVIWLYAHLFGGDVNNITPGLEQIKKMKDSGHLIFWNDVNEFLRLIKSGDVDLGMYWDGRTWAFHDEGNPDVLYINPKPGAVIQPNLITKVKNGNPLAWKFINYALSAPPEACWGNKMQYGMANQHVKFDEKVAPRITKLPEILWPPFSEMPGHLSRWVEEWNKTVGQ